MNFDKTTCFRQCFLALTFSLSLVSLPVAADGLSRDEAISQAQARNGGGEVLAVKEQNKNGKGSYLIKLIANGKVRVFVIQK